MSSADQLIVQMYGANFTEIAGAMIAISAMVVVYITTLETIKLGVRNENEEA